jgi:hypothetical protein
MIPTFRAVAGLLCLTVLGSPGRAAEPALEDTVITSDNFDLRSTDKETLTILWGQVVITATNLRVTCDRAELVSVRGGDPTQLVAKQNRFKSMLLTGHVTILQRDSNREATCGRAEILPTEDKITLTDHPKIVDRDKDGKPEFTYTGDPLVLLRGERRVTGTKVEIIGPQLKDLGFDKNKPGPVAAPAPAAEPPK